MLIVLAFLFINSRWGQGIIKNKAVAFLQEKLQTEVSVGRLDLSIPNYVALEDVFVQDKANDTLASVGRLKVEIGMLQLISGKIAIHNVILENTYANLYRNYPDTSFNFDFIAAAFASGSPKEPEVATDTSTSTIDLNVEQVHFSNVRFNFLDYSGGVQFKIALDTLGVLAAKTDINTLSFHLNDVVIAGVTSSVVTDTSIIPSDTTSSSSSPTIIVDNIDLSRTNFSFDDVLSPKQKEGIDYVHLGLTDIVIKGKDVFYTLDSMSGNVERIAAKEKSGLDLQKLATQFKYHNKGAELKNLHLKTNHTELKDYLSVQYDSLGALQDRMGDMLLNIDLQNSVVGVQDILIFVPDLREQDLFKNNATAHFQLAAEIKGALRSLDINDFYLAGLNGTVVKVNGKLNGLPEAEQINYDLNIPVIKSTEQDLLTFIPKDVVTDINLPNSFELTGNIIGTTMDYNPDIKLTSTDGSATVKGYLHMSGGEGNEEYKLYVTTQQLNIGRILKQEPTLGSITSNLLADGRGFDIERMTAAIRGDISSLGAMGYNYSGISLDGKIKQQQANIDLISKDVNANLHLIADADLRNEHPALKGRLLVDSFNMYAVKLTEDTLALRTNIDFDIPVLNPDYLYADILISQTGINQNNTAYFIDTFSIAAKSTTDSGQHIDVQSNFLQALITGKMPLTKSGDFIQSQIHKYYSLTGVDTTIADSAYNLSLTASVINQPILHTVLPDIKNFYPISLNANISNSDVNLTTNIPELNYGDIFIDSAVIKVYNTPEQKLAYNLSMDNFSQGSLQMWYPTVAGDVAENVITTNAIVRDIEHEDRFTISASMTTDSEKQVVQLGKNLMLNYSTWDVSDDNKIVLQGDGLYADNFKLSHGNGSIALQSDEQNPMSPLNVLINNFRISNITEILQQDTVLANGILNSKLKIHNALTEPRATGELTVDSLAVMAETIGNLDVVLTDASANEVDTRITLLGQGNDVVIDGSYYAKPVNNNNFGLNVSINSLDMTSAEGLSMGYLKNSSGKLTGKMAVTGTTDAPSINGKLQTDSLKTTVKMLGTPFSMPNETIEIQGDEIVLEDFKIYDDQGHKGTIDGSVYITNPSEPVVNLVVEADEWQVLNSTKVENEMFYGRVLLSTDMRLMGLAAAPAIDGNLTIHDSTDFTIIIPDDNPAIEERRGVVKFVDKSAPAGYEYAVNTDTLPSLAVTPGTDLNLNVAIEKNAVFNVIVDQASGDLLRVKGEANLNTQVNPDGTIGLAGVYALKDGAYELNYSLVKRRFKIQEGSEIKFAGDPLKAEVDITAAYTSNIPPYELVQNELAGQNANFYKQRLPFSVVLNLTGEILEPEVDFDIQLPEERNYRVNSEVLSTVQGKLGQLRNNPSEMNKQVFAALILNKFLAADPFESLGGTSAEYVARQSASRFISSQLNKLAENFVKGLEINMDLQSTEDYTTGEKRNRTDLNLSATKRLFNDRLSVTVGNNFELEGAEDGNDNNSNLIPGNLAADYLLTEDGRYLVRLFRRRDNINVVDGVSVETGVSFVFTLDYERFRTVIKNGGVIREEEEEDAPENQGGTQ